MKQSKKGNPYDDFSDQILLIVKKSLNKKVQYLYLDSPLSEFGLDSIMVTKIVSMINNLFKLKLSPVTLYGHKTVRDVAYDLYGRFQEKIDAAEVNLQSINFLYEKENEPQVIACDAISNRDHLMIFSAKCKDDLKMTLQNVADNLKKRADESGLITTLELELMSTCRPEQARLAIIAQDNKELLAEINYFISGKSSNYIYADEIEYKVDDITVFSLCNDAKEFLRNSFHDGGIKKIAALWSLGVEIDWLAFFGENKQGINRVGLMERQACVI